MRARLDQFLIVGGVTPAASVARATVTIGFRGVACRYVTLPVTGSVSIARQRLRLIK